jgi:hypothetical protein
MKPNDLLTPILKAILGLESTKADAINGRQWVAVPVEAFTLL